MGDVFLIVWPFALGGLGSWLATSRGRSGVVWFFVVMVTGPIGLGILAALPRQIFTCPRCTHPYYRGSATCEACGATLPAEGMADQLIVGERYDQQCPQCDVPYREDDYQPDADRIFCTTCKAELPRRAAS